MRRPSAGWLDRHAPYLLIAPTLLGILLVDVYPLLFNALISLQERKIATRRSPSSSACATTPR